MPSNKARSPMRSHCAAVIRAALGALQSGETRGALAWLTSLMMWLDPDEPSQEEIDQAFTWFDQVRDHDNRSG